MFLQENSLKPKPWKLENLGSLFFMIHNSFYTTPNAMKLILNESRLTELFIYIKYVSFGLIMREI